MVREQTNENLGGGAGAGVVLGVAGEFLRAGEPVSLRDGAVVRAGSVWRPMTEAERAVCRALDPSRVRYPVASPPKRLGRSLALQAALSAPVITDRQAEVMWLQAWRFRRQLPRDVFAHVRAWRDQQREGVTEEGPARGPDGAGGCDRSAIAKEAAAPGSSPRVETRGNQPCAPGATAAGAPATGGGA